MDDNIPLNDDCLYLIFEHIELSGLLKMAQISAKFYTIALYEFKHKYSNQLIRIKDELKWHNYGGYLEQMYSNYTQTDQFILFEDYEFLIDTLKYFGCLVKRFQVFKFEDGNVIKSIFSHLNKYSIGSLVELIVIDIENIAWLNEFKRPFPKVHKLSLFDNDYRPAFPASKLEFSKDISRKFPNLRQLSYYNRRGFDNAFPNEYFPHLEYAIIEFSFPLANRVRIDQFLKLNPHIRSLEVANFVDDYIIKIHSFVPKLEKLSICDGSTDSINIKRPIHFEHIKSFHAFCYHVKSLTNISFSNLENLGIVYSPELYVNWNEFIQNNRNITRLEIDLASNSYFTGEWENDMIDHLERLPSSIIEITLISRHQQLDKYTVVGILKRRQNLMKFTYKTTENIGTEELRNELETNWNTTILDNLGGGLTGLQFARKF